jgi:lipoate-protein ligase A
MALDHAVASCLESDEAVLRLYSWRRPTVSFGRNEPSAGLYSISEAAARGIDYVRRPTGGRAVLHDHEVTYLVAAPARALGGARAAYTAINEALSEALRSLGAEVGISAGGPTLAPAAGPCFQSPAAGEVVFEGRKLVGSAQARIGKTLLQHGSIILDGDQSRLGALHGGAGNFPAPATLGDLIGEVSREDVSAAVIAQMEGCLGGDWVESEYSGRELTEAERLETERYAKDEWTWRR